MSPPALAPGEIELLERQIRRKKLALYFSAASVAAAVGFGACYAKTGRLDFDHGVVIVLLLIGGKNHLRIYRLSGILEKLSR